MKKMFKKLFAFLFAITCLVAIVGCDGSNDPSKKCPGCNAEGVTHDKCETCGEYVCASDHNHDGKKYTSETYPWATPQTDSLKLTASYVGKDFIKDGIGEVSRVVRYVDGDTTIFQLTSGEHITVRYNGINTPESTYRVEPWGFAASSYNKTLYKDALENGAKIVLQTESLTERLDSTGTRYLAWIWLVYPNGDTRLVNLDLAEKGYGQVKNAGQYAKYFNDAIYDISVKYGLRVYGEKDPNYDYSTTAKEMTIREIREQYGTKEAVNNATANGFTSPLIKISGLVVRKNGNANAYIQQYDQETGEYYGIYVYGGYNAISKLLIGSYAQIEGKIGYYYGSLQITDVTSNDRIKLLSAPDENQITALDKTIDEIDDIYNYKDIGNLVTIHNLRVTGYNDSDKNSSFTIYCKYTNASGQEKQFNIRVDSLVKLVDPDTKAQILSGSYFEGKTIASITGIVNYYNGATTAPGTNYENGHIQLGLSSMNDVTFVD